MSTLYIKITEECNMHCPFCYIKQKPGTITLKKVAAFCDKYSPDRIIFHGGEPLLYPEIILDIINQYPDKKFAITSNLTLPLTKERLDVLRKCDIATSYSIDRFHNAKHFLQFIDNLYEVKNFADITILVTLSREQLKELPEQLAIMLQKLPHKYILLERLYEEQYDAELAQKTDLYMRRMMQLLPAEENMLMMQMQHAIDHHVIVFPKFCNKFVFTLGPNGLISNCPNLCNKEAQRRKRKECIECDFYEYCQGDCLSFQNGCMFPKKTFNWIYNRSKKYGNNSGKSNKAE